MKSRESKLMILYLITDLIILNLSILFVVSLSSIMNFKDYHLLSSYLLHANLSWVITYFILSNKNIYLRDGYINVLEEGISSKEDFDYWIGLALEYNRKLVGS